MSTNEQAGDRRIPSRDVFHLARDKTELTLLQQAAAHSPNARFRVLSSETKAEEGEESPASFSAAAFGDYGRRCGFNEDNFRNRALEVQQAGGFVVKVTFMAADDERTPDPTAFEAYLAEHWQPRLTPEQLAIQPNNER